MPTAPAVQPGTLPAAPSAAAVAAPLVEVSNTGQMDLLQLLNTQKEPEVKVEVEARLKNGWFADQLVNRQIMLISFLIHKSWCEPGGWKGRARRSTMQGGWVPWKHRFGQKHVVLLQSWQTFTTSTTFVESNPWSWNNLNLYLKIHWRNIKSASASTHTINLGIGRQVPGRKVQCDDPHPAARGGAKKRFSSIFCRVSGSSWFMLKNADEPLSETTCLMRFGPSNCQVAASVPDKAATGGLGFRLLPHPDVRWSLFAFHSVHPSPGVDLNQVPFRNDLPSQLPCGKPHQRPSRLGKCT